LVRPATRLRVHAAPVYNARGGQRVASGRPGLLAHWRCLWHHHRVSRVPVTHPSDLRDADEHEAPPHRRSRILALVVGLVLAGLLVSWALKAMRRRASLRATVTLLLLALVACGAGPATGSSEIGVDLTVGYAAGGAVPMSISYLDRDGKLVRLTAETPWQLEGVEFDLGDAFQLQATALSSPPKGTSLNCGVRVLGGADLRTESQGNPNDRTCELAGTLVPRASNSPVANSVTPAAS